LLLIDIPTAVVRYGSRIGRRRHHQQQQQRIPSGRSYQEAPTEETTRLTRQFRVFTSARVFRFEVSSSRRRRRVFQVAVNPEHKIPEMTYANNAAVCSVFYSETFVKIHDCVVQNP